MVFNRSAAICCFICAGSMLLYRKRKQATESSARSRGDAYGMKEVTKEEFKEVYFKLGGGAATGWDLEYWNSFFETEERPGMKYLLEEPETPEHVRMMIVNDYDRNEYRLFFLTEESEESFFDFPGESQNKARRNKSLQRAPD